MTLSRRSGFNSFNSLQSASQGMLRVRKWGKNSSSRRRGRVSATGSATRPGRDAMSQMRRKRPSP
jgi:hypothetical protein